MQNNGENDKASMNALQSILSLFRTGYTQLGNGGVKLYLADMIDLLRDTDPIVIPPDFFAVEERTNNCTNPRCSRETGHAHQLPLQR